MSFSHSEAWLQMLSEVMVGGKVVMPRGLVSKELTFTHHFVYDPLSFPVRAKGREFRDVIGVLEGLSLVGEFSVPELFTDRVKKFGDFQDGGIMWGAYGARTHGQLGDIVTLLADDPDSRQAVMTFYDAKRDLYRQKLDIPCTISAQFKVRDQTALDLGISMRSNDLWLGTPYDFTQFSILQATVAQALRRSVGHYHHSVGSLHLYDRDTAKTFNLDWEGGPSMPFPLWDEDSIRQLGDPLNRLAGIQRRARRLLLNEQASIETPFEEWAWRLLWGA